MGEDDDYGEVGSKREVVREDLAEPEKNKEDIPRQFEKMSMAVFKAICFLLEAFLVSLGIL